MDIFGVLALLGGLAIFLYGMDLLGEGLTGASGGKLENILEKLTSNPIKALMERQSVNEFALLDDRFLESPSLAVEHCKTVIGNMADISRESFVNRYYI
jgi:Na+/phosphate symporter